MGVAITAAATGKGFKTCKRQTLVRGSVMHRE